MTTTIQIRNVPEATHHALTARSALVGKSLGDFIREELVAMAVLPPAAELKQQLATAKPFAMKASSATIVRRERDAV